MVDDNKPKYNFDELSKKYLEDKPKTSNDENSIKGFGKAYGAFTSFIFTLFITILLAIFLGKYLDELLNTTPLFILLFLFLGIMASFRNLIVYSK